MALLLALELDKREAAIKDSEAKLLLREQALDRREKALKDDLAALEASTPEGIKAARDRPVNATSCCTTLSVT